MRLRTITAIILSATALFSATAQRASLVVPDNDKAELFGSVRSCTTSIYEATRTGDDVKKNSLYMSATVDYDAHGFGTRMIMQDVSTTYKNTYGENGQIESVKTYVNGSFDGTSQYAYEPTRVVETILDNTGAKVGTVIHTKGKSIIDDGETKITTFYNDNNVPTKIVSEMTTEFGSIHSSTVATCNSHSVVEELTTSITSPTENYQISVQYSDYKYDNRGNWIYRVKSVETEGMRIEERVIEYYEN